jgi:hypothetical protein
VCADEAGATGDNHPALGGGAQWSTRG